MNSESLFDGLDPLVAAVLNDARRTPPVEIDDALLTAMSAAAVEGSLAPTPSTSRRKAMIGKLITAKAFAIAGAFVLTGGVAAAATGTLPDPVQSPVSHAAEHVGVHIPNGDHGATVSDAAHDKTGEDSNHGGDVSTVAGDNHGHEGGATTSTTAVSDDNGNHGSTSNGNGPGRHDEPTTSTTVKHENSGEGEHHEPTTTTVATGGHEEHHGTTTTTVHNCAGCHDGPTTSTTAKPVEQQHHEPTTTTTVKPVEHHDTTTTRI